MKKRFLNFLIVVTMVLSLLPVQAFADDVCNHIWSEWEVYYEPTCVKSGQKERHCLDCYTQEYADIPATGQHEWDDWYTVKAATISKTGLKERECIVCGETQTSIIPKSKPYIKLSKKTVKLQTTKTYTLKVKYAKGDSIKKCKSSNTKVATVSKKGKIKAKSNGTAKITVTLKSGKKATCKVKVSAKKEATVYWVPNGGVYHKTPNCPTLKRSRTIYSGLKSKCPKPRPCKVCY
ncbi:MAG: Ig-like domain-containing protein [Lachnospiraceae bacterium]|nr:Ig-like domain-containing protein [Lachnospiraceae bacterium]